MILLIIISNNILLNPSIAFTYYFVSDGLFFWYNKLYSSIIKNWFFYIALLRSVPVTILFIGKRFLRYYIIV